MYSSSALQAGAQGKLHFDTYDREPSALSWDWCFVGLRPFQGGSLRVILSWSRLYLELRLPADQSTVLKSCTVILVLLGDFGDSWLFPVLSWAPWCDKQLPAFTKCFNSHSTGE